MKQKCSVRLDCKFGRRVDTGHTVDRRRAVLSELRT